jgi:hypothetical protein
MNSEYIAAAAGKSEVLKNNWTKAPDAVER